MKLKYLLQNWMIQHHRNPGLLRAARLIYRAGLTVMVWRLKKRREVSAIMLRRGMTRSDWIPGGSDYDLTIIAEDVEADRIAEASFLTLRRFARLWPIPAEVSVFSRTEMKQYLDFGNLRSLEAVEGWKPLHGEWSPSPRERDPLEISVHSFSEAVDQFSRLTELFLKPTLSRAETRHFLKHFAETLICCELAAQGKFSNVTSRWEWLQENRKGHDLPAFLFQSLDNGFSPLTTQERFEIWSAATAALHQTSQKERLSELPPAWEMAPLETTPKGLILAQELWFSLRDEAERQGITLLAIHWHNRLAMVLADDAIARINQKHSAFTRLMRLLSYQQEDKIPPLVLTQSALRLLSSTETYQHQTFYSTGIHWDATTSRLHRLSPISNPWVNLSLRAKYCALPSELRRARVLEPDEARKIERGYYRQLVNRLGLGSSLPSDSSL